MRKSLVLMEKKAMGTYFKEEKGSYIVSRVRKVSLKGQKECTVGRMQWHNRAKNMQISVLIHKAAHR